MERVSFVLHIDPQDQAQYIERHQAVYPELLQAFGEVGIHTYSIFLHEGTLFAYMEVDNYQEAMDQLAVHPANQRWQQFMADMLIPNQQGTTSEVIPEVFHYHS
ncbi:L-rhamnose mutarotase [Paenibacillus sp. PsM32]|uniref:L-rhamnose mutarotase n=1 Tax=unclassified Paenibacillus TaxID=185978 RepID=UPI00263AF3B3|nr:MULTISPECIES: L-rhamnose mutarotase [unclassified Paenibacillus]MDN4618229.1 L-rhamnose mutarotase [Paenibacillus sp. PsM32]MDQ1234252.1 L-rhamnose mutarotase [Paenibacillus sp. SORGH_AS_0306]MDR6111298.1 L-rhamnose mutarotase [Paenibacillus sp. SORGH_AS_0338]